MKGIVFSLLLVPLAVGCAVSKDGVDFASKPHAAEGGVLLVGTTGAVRTLSEAECDEVYRHYVAAAAEPHRARPARRRVRAIPA